MQSLSHWDSEKVFVQKFLFEATFISFFYAISYNFTHKKLSSSSLLKKKVDSTPTFKCVYIYIAALQA